MTQGKYGDDQTPLMKQYWDLKSQAGDALLLFRMGDFYELFGDDAVTAAGILEITLTSRDKNKPNPVPMCGVPYHSIQGYIQRLLKAGKKVAIGEQMEDPATSAKSGAKIVRREVVRIFTPAVQFDSESAEAAYLAVALQIPNSESWVLACLDSSTGESLIGDPMSVSSVGDELSRMPIRHLLRIGHQLPLEVTEIAQSLKSTLLLEDLPSNYLSEVQAIEALKRHYQLQTLDAFVPNDTSAHALGILLTYALRSQKQDRLAHLRFPSPLHKPSTMTLGPHTAEHLDLPDLYILINRTRSSLGARQLRRWLYEPLQNTSEISRRQEGVRELAESGPAIERVSAVLGDLYDLERISGRVNTRLANPRDTLALGRSLAILPKLSELLASTKRETLCQLHQLLSEAAATLLPLSERILRTQKEEAPITSKDAGIFSHGTTPELDHLLTLTEDGQKWLIELEARERAATGIPSLKVRYNRVFGYYLEVTQAHLKNVPSHYQRKQTTVGAERFFTEELKKFEDEIVTASSKQKALEQQLFEDLIQQIQSLTLPIMDAARALGELDALTSLARLTEQPGWVFPAVDDSLDLAIEAGRHPLVDRGGFVPNDTHLSPQTRQTLLITGPNMGGKSTVMRQVALILILGQMGAPVPAKRARWGYVSSLYTRIGAHDAIARGQSTFMVEMSELAHILHFADERSLIILDEIGRGTSTYDGISVAWATLEWICAQVRARTLFATHYHELTRLAGTLPLLANAHLAVEATRDKHLRFLYQLREGPANESFGVHVARIAGLPNAVVERAWRVLEELEKGGTSEKAALVTAVEDLSQMSFFDQPNDKNDKLDSTPVYVVPPVIRELEDVNIDDLTPIQALNFLLKLQDSVKSQTS